MRRRWVGAAELEAVVATAERTAHAAETAHEDMVRVAMEASPTWSLDRLEAALHLHHVDVAGLWQRARRAASVPLSADDDMHISGARKRRKVSRPLDPATREAILLRVHRQLVGLPPVPASSPEV